MAVISLLLVAMLLTADARVLLPDTKAAAAATNMPGNYPLGWTCTTKAACCDVSIVPTRPAFVHDGLGDHLAISCSSAV